MEQAHSWEVNIRSAGHYSRFMEPQVSRAPSGPYPKPCESNPREGEQKSSQRYETRRHMHELSLRIPRGATVRITPQKFSDVGVRESYIQGPLQLEVKNSAPSSQPLRANSWWQETTRVTKR